MAGQASILLTASRAVGQKCDAGAYLGGGIAVGSDFIGPRLAFQGRQCGLARMDIPRPANFLELGV